MITNKYDQISALKTQEKQKDLGFHFFKYVLIFMLGSLLGVLYEDLLQLVRTGRFATHRGVIFLPFNPLYGAGFVLGIWILWKIPQWYHQFTYGSIILGTVEYFASFFEELLTGSTSWGYSSVITNIDGRTTVIYALVWGMAATLVLQFVHPHFLKYLLKIDRKWVRTVVYVFFAFYMFDIVFSHTAVILAGMRAQGYHSRTFIGRFFEKYFSGDVLKNFFVNKSF